MTNDFFKKAYELCKLWCLKIALIVFSLGKKVSSWGHPVVKGTTDEFLGSQKNDILEPVESNMGELNRQLAELQNQLEAHKAYGETLAKEKKPGETLHCWEAPVEDLGLEQLHSLRSRLIEFKSSVMNLTRDLAMIQQIQS